MSSKQRRNEYKRDIVAYTSKGTWPGIRYNDDKYYSFKYIPYAQIPVGNLRFADPVDIPTFEDLNLGDNGNDEGNDEGNDIYKGRHPEDCLFVHIYTPAEAPPPYEYNNRPVIVFVPSLHLVKTESYYGGEFLMAENIVLVVLSYRHDLLGFSGFQAPNEELNISGDAGLKDIIKGFEFVKREIRNFEGSPDNITAYGQGLSCAYIRTLSAGPFSGKLFHKMILSSSMEHDIGHAPPLRCKYYLGHMARTINPYATFDDDKACAQYLRKISLHCLQAYAKEMFSIETDIGYVIGTLHLATTLAEKMDPHKVYLYKFAVDILPKGSKNQSSVICRAAGSGDELPYIFKNEYKEFSDKNITSLMAGIWAKFARTGNPNQANGSSAIWQPVGERLTHYFEIDSRGGAYREFTDFEKARFLFWERIYNIKFFSGPTLALGDANETHDLERKAEDEKLEDKVANIFLKPDDSRVPTDLYKKLPKENLEGIKVTAYTGKGPIEGDICLYNDKTYYSFQHVPYAQVPVGNLRFAAPRSIYSFGDFKPLKLDENERYGPEDQLFLHIYTPEVNEDENPSPLGCPKKHKRPVIVFVPGRLSPKAEEYRSEDLYGPQFLLQEDVVVVVLSYRRDILGFTAFKTPNAELDVPIDAGIQDIIQGLFFVKNEIRYFGGCPYNVTAYGQGMGATYIRMIAAKYPKTKVFHKMILSSSMEHATGIVLPKSRYEVRLLVKKFSQKFDADDKTCIELLRKLPIEDLLNCDSLFLKEEQDRVYRIEHLKDILTTPGYRMVMPVMIGYNSMEGLMDPIISNGCHEDLRQVLRWSVARATLGNCQYKYGITNEVIKEIIARYETITETKEKKNENLLKFVLSDINYSIGTIVLANHFASKMGTKYVYMYRFGVNLDCNLTARLYDSPFHDGAAHADELGYIFKTPITKCVAKDSRSDLVIREMAKMWVTFARTGIPSSEKNNLGLTNVNSRSKQEVWESCFRIDTTQVSYGKTPEVEVRRFLFWVQSLGPEYSDYFKPDVRKTAPIEQWNNLTYRETTDRDDKKRT